ncbi:unnamed protein product [Urochloa humidicola]
MAEVGRGDFARGGQPQNCAAAPSCSVAPPPPLLDFSLERTRARLLFDGMPQRQLKVYRRRKFHESRAAGIDALPDGDLQYVLGFLPAQEAVRTCVFVRR